MIKSAALFATLAMIVCLLAACVKETNMKPDIDAGNSIMVKVVRDSAFLEGVASDKDGEIASYLWTKVSGEGIVHIQNPTSSSTWVKNLVEGVYVFQFMVTDKEGGVATDTVSISVLAADTLTTSSTPANNPTEVHLFGNNNGIDQTHQQAPEIAGGSGTYFGDPVNVRALLKFDLSNISGEAKILSAKLTLFSNPNPLNGQDDNPNYGSDNTLLIQRVTTTWDYETVNWLNQPQGNADGQIEIPHTVDPFLDLVDIDVTNLVANMVTEGNNGFLLKLKTEAIYNWRIFCSSKYPDTSKHPKLEVVYAQ